MRICSDVSTGKGCGIANDDTAERCVVCAMSLANTPRISNPGERIRDYTIVSVIGFGKFGAVYEARAILDPTVCIALKETLHSNSMQTFRANSKRCARCSTPICPATTARLSSVGAAIW